MATVTMRLGGYDGIYAGVLTEEWSGRDSLRNERWQLYAGSQTGNQGTRQTRRSPAHSRHNALQ